jgi:TRAP-type C4-dicarboxylate transport system permease small subunit
MMNKKMKKKESFWLKAYDRLCYVCVNISTWIMLGMAFSITYEVVARYFFSSPTKWVNDFTDYAMLYTTLFVSAWLLKNGDHVCLTTVLDRLSPRSRGVMEVINSFIGAIICSFITWYGAVETWDTIKNNIAFPRAIPIPKYYIVWVIPFGFLLLSIQFVRDAFKFLGTSDDKSRSGNG